MDRARTSCGANPNFSFCFCGLSGMQGPRSSGKCEDFPGKSLLALGPLLGRFATGMTEELGEEPVSRHVDKPMDGVHRSPLPGLSERS